MKILRSIDLKLFIIVLAFLFISMIMIFSASSITAGEKFGDPFLFLKKQILWTFVSTIVMFISLNIN